MNSLAKGYRGYCTQASSKKRAVSAYRSLMKTEKDLFRNDPTALFKAVVKTREGFEKNKLEKDSAKIEQLIKEAVETQNFLLRNIVQADQSETGAYSKTFAKTFSEIITRT